MPLTKVLVVDDEPAICRGVQNFLVKKNYDVSIASNRKDAIQAVKECRPRILFLDISLGQESGLDVLKEIQEIDNNIIVIMLTTFDDINHMRRAKELGAYDYIAKPFNNESLKDSLTQKLANLVIKKKI